MSTFTRAPRALRFDVVPGEIDREEVVPIAAVVAQERRRTVEIADHDVDVAVVVEIAERRTPADAGRAQRRAGVLADLGERAVTPVPVQQRALPVRRLQAGVRSTCG